jgi:hypothetical protein
VSRHPAFRGALFAAALSAPVWFLAALAAHLIGS